MLGDNYSQTNESDILGAYGEDIAIWNYNNGIAVSIGKTSGKVLRIASSEIDTIENKLSAIEKCGYTNAAHFVLDDKCWIDNYYQSLLENAEAFLKKV